MLFFIIIGILFIILSIVCFFSDEYLLSFLTALLAGTLLISSCCTNVEQNRILNTPAIIEQARPNIRTPEEKEKINSMIKDYNEAIKEYHEELLTDRHRSKKEQAIFELKPIEPIE